MNCSKKYAIDYCDVNVYPMLLILIIIIPGRIALNYIAWHNFASFTYKNDLEKRHNYLRELRPVINWTVTNRMLYGNRIETTSVKKMDFNYQYFADLTVPFEELAENFPCQLVYKDFIEYSPYARKFHDDCKQKFIADSYDGRYKWFHNETIEVTGNKDGFEQHNVSSFFTSFWHQFFLNAIFFLLGLDGLFIICFYGVSKTVIVDVKKKIV